MATEWLWVIGYLIVGMLTVVGASWWQNATGGEEVDVIVAFVFWIAWPLLILVAICLLLVFAGKKLAGE